MFISPGWEMAIGYERALPTLGARAVTPMISAP
jgi:hypothetical protein